MDSISNSFDTQLQQLVSRVESMRADVLSKQDADVLKILLVKQESEVAPITRAFALMTPVACLQHLVMVFWWQAQYSGLVAGSI